MSLERISSFGAGLAPSFYLKAVTVHIGVL